MHSGPASQAALYTNTRLRSQVCVCVCVRHFCCQPTLKVYTIFTLFLSYFPFENMIKKYVACSVCGVHLRKASQKHRGVLAKRGQRGTYGKAVGGGRPGGTRPPSFASGKTSVTKRTT